MTKSESTGWYRSGVFPKLVFSLLVLGLAAPGASAAIDIACTSGDQFVVDASVNLLGRYVSYQITNTGPAVAYDLWVEVGGFTGGVVSLAPYETGLCHFDSLIVGETVTAFFYLQASGATSIPQSHTVSVYSGQPPSGTLLASGTYSFASVGTSVSAASSKITTIVSGPTPPTLGGILTIEVSGEGGIIGKNGVMIFSPAGFPDWYADTYELISTQVTLSGGVNAVLNDQLFYTASSQKDFGYHAIYTFRVSGIAPGPAMASPVAMITSGSRMKHDNTSSYYNINPILPAVNPLVLQKSVLPPSISGGDSAVYAITLLNSGAVSVQIDSIIDLLPTSPGAPVYLNGSSRWNAATCGDPVIGGSQLKWVGPFAVEPGGAATLSFGAVFPSTEGAYTNFAFAVFGGTLVDTTPDAADYAPASATVLVGMPDIMMLKSAQVISDPINGNVNPKAIPGALVLYTITITNRGVGMADDHSVVASDFLGANAALFVGDLGGGPVVFADGPTSSGISYTFESLSSVTDDLAFSSDSGAAFTYTPLPDSAGFDAAVTNLMVNPGGLFQGAVGTNYPSFTVRFMVRLR